MNTDNKKVDARLRKAVARAFKKVMDSLKDEPSVVIVTGSGNVMDESSVRGITGWLFRRRDEDGS